MSASDSPASSPVDAAAHAEARKLERTMKPAWVFAIALGSAVGWGAFILPVEWLADGGTAGALIGFAIGTVLMAIIAVSYGLVIRALPVTGGELSFTLHAFGRYASFVVGWFLALAYACIIALNASAMTLVFRQLFPGIMERAGAAESVSPALAERVRAGAEAGAQAYRDFAATLRAELRPHAPQEDAVGIEHYRLASRVFLGAEVDLEETYRWGQEELARIIAAQKADAERIRPGATVEEARAILDADPARTLTGTQALRDWMQGLSDRALEAMKEHFEIPSPMDRVECMIAPTQEGGIYYTGPSDDFSRPGRMWWSVPAGEDQFTTWAETTTVYHEGVPGHHLQIATAMMARDELNLWRRSFCWTSGHGEGWALYAERLMDEFGFLEDAGDHLGMLDMQRMRAARVVFDIGYHCGFDMPESEGGGAWTPERGYDFLAKHLILSEGQRRFEFTRYLGWPGQAPAYKVGQRIWEQIRAEHEAREGEEFDLKAFHTRALRLGSMGLDTLREALA